MHAIDGTHAVHDFRLRSGETLPQAVIAYVTQGSLAPDGRNAVLLTHGYTSSHRFALGGTSASEGSWGALVGPGKPIDTDRWFVVCANSLGSCKGSTGPASVDPATGNAYRLAFPELALEDLANASHALVRHLGVERLACLIGNSMGGMSALAYMLRHPGAVRAHASVDTAPQAQPFAIAIRSLQREAIRLDPGWAHGEYDIHREEGGTYPDTGMSIARKLGVITYRSAMEWNGRFARIRLDAEQREDEPFGFEFQVESYLAAHARRFVRSFDPNCYLYLSRASDWFDIAEYGGGSVLEGLKRIRVERALVIGVSTDILFPLEQQEQIADGLRAAGAEVEFVALDSPQGHDAFLVDIPNYSRAIGGFLERLRAAPGRR
jgi:homoserine O-acetyltransferase